MSCTVTSLSSYPQVIDALNYATPQDLILYDIDEVVITAKDRILRPCADNHKPTKQIYKRLFKPYADPVKEQKYGEFTNQTDVELVDPRIPEHIESLQKKGLHVIGLTRLIPGAGRCGSIESMENHRFDELSAYGINFNLGNVYDVNHESKIDPVTLKQSAPYVFDLPVKDNRIPALKDGIIYANPYQKGPVLEKYLHELHGLTGRFPTTIWFIDNAMSNIHSVAETCRKLGIRYQGICYYDKMFVEETVNQSFDPEWGLFQYKTFERTGIWYPDSQRP